jgi:hypothetical protein
MTAITVASLRQAVPNAGVKEIVIMTSAAAATGFTWDATGYFSTIWGTYLSDSTGAVKIATFSSLAVTLGTISTGVHCLRVWGV